MEFSAEWRRVNGSAPGDMATAEGLQRPPRPRAARRRVVSGGGHGFHGSWAPPPLQPASLRFSLLRHFGPRERNKIFILNKRSINSQCPFRKVKFYTARPISVQLH